MYGRVLATSIQSRKGNKKYAYNIRCREKRLLCVKKY